jgi:chaperonin cofactor prefoldin
MPLPLSAFPEFQALQQLYEQAAARMDYLEQQLPEWVSLREALRLTNLTYSSFRRVVQRPGTLVRCKSDQQRYFNRDSLLTHNESRTLRPRTPSLKQPYWMALLNPNSMKEIKDEIDLTQYAAFQQLQQQYQQLFQRLDTVESKLPEWVDGVEACRITGVSRPTLGRERKKAESFIVWKEDHGIHYLRSSLLSYNNRHIVNYLK